VTLGSTDDAKGASVGYFIYDNNHEVAFDDRMLAHLQAVIIDKFRRNEKFAMNLVDGRRFITVWMTPRSPVQFVYEGSRPLRLNPGWVDLLSDTSAMTGTLRLLAEPAEEGVSAGEDVASRPESVSAPQ
jgi:hypothetical protein